MLTKTAENATTCFLLNFSEPLRPRIKEPIKKCLKALIQGSDNKVASGKTEKSIDIYLNYLS